MVVDREERMTCSERQKRGDSGRRVVVSQHSSRTRRYWRLWTEKAGFEASLTCFGPTPLEWPRKSLCLTSPLRGSIYESFCSTIIAFWVRKSDCLQKSPKDWDAMTMACWETEFRLPPLLRGKFSFFLSMSIDWDEKLRRNKEVPLYIAEA